MITRLLALLFAASVAVSAQAPVPPRSARQNQSATRPTAQAARQSQPPSQGSGNTDRETQRARTSPQNSTAPMPSPPVLEAATQTVPIAPPPPNGQGADHWTANPDWWMVGLTGLTLIATVVLVVLAIRQFGVQKRQTEDALQIAREANDETKRAGEASAKHAKRELYVTLRARLGVTDIEVFNFGRSDAPCTICVHVKNFGGKGAAVEKTWSFIDITDQPLPPTPTYAGSEWHVSGAPVEAGDTHQLMCKMTRTFNPAIWSHVSNEIHGTRLIITGVVVYRVGFGSSSKKLGFCRAYDPHYSELRGKAVFVDAGGSAYNYAE